MKTIKQFLRPITLLLAFLILLQGCTVYKSKPVTLDYAATANTKTKIKSKNNQTAIFKKIEIDDELFYGLRDVHKDDPFDVKSKEIIKILIETNSVESVRIKNKVMSTILPFAIPVVLFAGLLIGVALGGGVGGF